ncbi:MAG TPA: acyltransferase [Candidatus Limnocylindrales bacterium]|nr:acyltransferase [Candidatus Limnocylindrales bacterium]
MPRSAYVDTLRALAIARVYIHHTLWIGWFTMVFPSMSVMFALAGFLTAVSLDRGGVTRTVWSRVRRLLPPLWGLAVVAVPVMLAVGWNSVHWADLVYWVVPLANPTTSDWAGAFALALWYLRAYLWFVLLSPILWWFFRRWPIPTLLAPMVAAVVMHSSMVNVPPSRALDVVSSTALYGTAWMLGFARHTGLLDRLSWKVCGAIAAALGAAAGAWALFVTPDVVTEMFIGTAFVVILMRLHPSMQWLTRLPKLKNAIAALNARAVTIYVWHLPVLFAAGTIVATLSGLDPLNDTLGKTFAITLGTVFLVVAVMGTGWIEDLAARRRPMLIPVTAPAPAPARASMTQPARR